MFYELHITARKCSLPADEPIECNYEQGIFAAVGGVFYTQIDFVFS